MAFGISRRSFLGAAGLGFLGINVCGCMATHRGKRKGNRPNIIIMMADDMGYSDIGCYGGEIDTPNLNRLAEGGLRFKQFYNTARCCPTRAALITGLYSHQAGIGHMMTDRGLDGYRGDLNRECVTIAEVMKDAGYSTYMSGKWHVTRFKDKEGPKHNWPLQRGFEKFFGTIHGAGSFYDPNSLTRDNTPIVPGKDDFYYTDEISDNAVTSIREHCQCKQDKPFFMYVAYTSPHWPMHAKEADIAKYKGRYDDGWDVLRRERHKRMIEMGLVDARWKITDRDKKAPSWKDAKDKEWFTRRMEVYAAMIDCMDQGVGRVVGELKKQGQLENTLIMFLADNGGCAEEYGSRGKVKPDPSKPVVLKPMADGELQIDMQPKVTRDGRAVRTGYGVMPGAADTYIAYGLCWANASNTPFRMYKHWEHEGGISTPFIAHWPTVINDGGGYRNQVGHLIDLMATCVDAGDAKYPKVFQGNAITPMQGVSLLGAFADKEIEREALYWEHEGNRAARQGKWKIVAKGAMGKWELYDMEADRTETNDLAVKYPDRVEGMSRMWVEWAIRSKVLPWPYKKNPNLEN